MTRQIIRKCGNCRHFLRSAASKHTLFGHCNCPLPKTISHFFRDGVKFETRADVVDCDCFTEKRLK